MRCIAQDLDVVRRSRWAVRFRVDCRQFVSAVTSETGEMS